jgi:hypothetical protein
MLNGADFVAIPRWYHENYVVMQRVMTGDATSEWGVLNGASPMSFT